jgi:hypothetical protein
LQTQLADWANLKKTGISAFCARLRDAGQSVASMSTCQ